MHCVLGRGVGGARWKFYMMCPGSSEPSLVANSISTQISYAGSNFFLHVLAGSKMDDCIIVGKRERKIFFFILFLFYLTRQ